MDNAIRITRQDLNKAHGNFVLLALLIDMPRTKLYAVLKNHKIVADPGASNLEIAEALITGNHCRKNGTSILTPLTGDK